MLKLDWEEEEWRPTARSCTIFASWSHCEPRPSLHDIVLATTSISQAEWMLVDFDHAWWKHWTAAEPYEGNVHEHGQVSVVFFVENKVHRHRNAFCRCPLDENSHGLNSSWYQNSTRMPFNWLLGPLRENPKRRIWRSSCSASGVDLLEHPGAQQGRMNTLQVSAEQLNDQRDDRKQERRTVAQQELMNWLSALLTSSDPLWDSSL